MNEETPLLVVHDNANGEDGNGRKQLWKASSRLICESYPISLGYLLQSSIQLGTIFVAGNIGPSELAISGSSFMIATCTAWLVGTGGTSALDSLGSQAYGRDSKDKIIGIILQQCLLVITALYIPVCLLWIFSGPILLAFGQPLDLAYGTQEFLRYLAPSGIAYIYFETFKKFLQLQGIRLPCTIILCILSPINVLVNYWSANTMGWGLKGGALVTGAMYWIACFSTILYLILIDGKQGWAGFTTKCFHGLGNFAMTVGLGIVMIGAEWWAFEIIAIAAGTMGRIPTAAQSIVMTTDTIFAFIPFGIGVATTNRV